MGRDLRRAELDFYRLIGEHLVDAVVIGKDKPYLEGRFTPDQLRSIADAYEAYAAAVKHQTQ